jgi:peroxiredoxin
MYDSFGTVVIEGEEYDVAFRNTFIINDSGTIVHTYRDVSDVEEHVRNVIDDLNV